MQLELILALKIQRELYAIPRGWERFWKYIATMTGGTDDLVLPIVGMNPMGHDHNAARLDELIALDAEGIAAGALAEAERRLANVNSELKVCLVLNDDARGQWTNRYFTEAGYRFQSKGTLRRGFAIVPCWTSETWTADDAWRETLATIYRNVYRQCHGLPETLRQIMRPEGLAAVFAGGPPSALEADDLAYSRDVIQPHLDSTHFPTIFACLYGDEAATSAGYPPQGLSPRAGFGVAYDEAQKDNLTPEVALQ